MKRFSRFILFFIVIKSVFIYAKDEKLGILINGLSSSDKSIVTKDGVSKKNHVNYPEIKAEKNIKNIRQALPMEFFKPFWDDLVFNGTNDFEITEKDFYQNQLNIEIKRFVIFHITGKTLPGAKVYIPAEYVFLLNEKKHISKILTKSILLKKGEVIADKEGYFKLSLRLPISKVQLPIEVGPSNANSTSYKTGLYQLNLSVTPNEIEASTQKVLRDSPLFSNKNNLWLGLGANYLAYKQKSDENATDLELLTFEMPTFFLKYWRRINDEWNANFTFNIAPGDAKKAEGILTLVGESEYNWLIIVSEISYYPSQWKFKHFGGEARLGMIMGLQHHIVPFIESTGNSASEIEIVTNDIGLITTGIQYMVKKKRWVFETFMRYQVPVISGDVFEMKYNYAFDGSIGVYNKISTDWRFGVYWYGQMHIYDYFYNDKYIENFPDKGTNPVVGEQSLFFSNIEARLGYSW